MKRYGSWAVVAAGVAVILLTYIQNAFIGVYFDDHGLPDDVSSVASLALGLVGLALVAGGIVAATRSKSRE